MSGAPAPPESRSRAAIDDGIRDEHSTKVCPCARTAWMAATVRSERVRWEFSRVPSLSQQKSVMRGVCRLVEQARVRRSQTELAGTLGRAVAQERRAASLLVALADGTSRPGECRQGAEEAAVRLVRPRHRALTPPARLAQAVERTVVARAG